MLTLNLMKISQLVQKLERKDTLGQHYDLISLHFSTKEKSRLIMNLLIES